MKNSSSIQYKAVTFIAVVMLITALVLGGLSYWIIGRSQNREVSVYMNGRASEEAAVINETFIKTEAATHDIASIVKTNSFNVEAMQDQANRDIVISQVDHVFNAIMDYDEDVLACYLRFDPYTTGANDGIFLAKNSEGELEAQEITDIRKYDEDDLEHVGWYTLPKRAGKPMWMEPYYNKNISKWMISYVVPYFENDQLVAVIGIDIDFEKLVEEVDEYRFADDGYAFLKKADGSVHYHPSFFEGKVHGDEVDLASQSRLQQVVTSDSKVDVVSYNYEGRQRVGAVEVLKNGMQLFVCVDEAKAFSTKRTMLRTVAFVTLCVALLLILIARHFIGKLIKPIIRLTGAVKEIEKGNYDAELPPDRNDEIGVLIEGAKVMSRSLKKQKELSESALAEKNRELELAVEEAERANKAKSDFLSQMSHDIRTPMNAIIGMSVIAQDNMDDPVRLQDCLSKISSSSNYLLSLINDVLDMSRIESGNLSLSESEFSIPGLVEKTLTLVSQQVNAHHHEIHADVGHIMHENAIVDGLRLQQVFVNIVSNSIKYTEDGGKISIAVREIPTAAEDISHYQFIFKDNGIGMSEEFQKELFTPFVREKDDHQTEVKGTGLGMSITKAIIDEMGGEIQVQSKQGEGTTFIVELDLNTVEEIHELVDEDMRDQVVLIVDDNDDDLSNAASAFDQVGLRHDLAHSGQEALEMIKAKHDSDSQYLAVVADWRMPVMDGVELTDKIRTEVHDEVPVIIFSAYIGAQAEEDAIKAGADAFISKPLYSSKVSYTMRHLADGGKQIRTAKIETGLSDFELKGMRILIVDDMIINLEIASNILEMTGAEVETASNGKIAVEKYLSHPKDWYDLILMDLRMPIMDGYEATRTIRASGAEGCQDIPIIAMSADAFEEDKQRSKAAGMNAHITKPLEIELLKKVLSEYLLEQEKGV